MTAAEAVERFVPDGSSVSIANFLTAIPFTLVHEVIRQHKKNLTIWSQSGIEEINLLVAGGCTNKVVTAYNFRAGGEWASTEFERAIKEKRLEVEDMSNFAVLAMLWAGALGYSFMPVLKGIKETDVFRVRTLLGDDKFKVIQVPVHGRGYRGGERRSAGCGIDPCAARGCAGQRPVLGQHRQQQMGRARLQAYHS